MTLRFAFAFTLLAATSVAAAAQTPAPAPPQAAAPAVDTTKVDGAWAMNVDTPQGAMAVSLVLKSDGKKITGTITSPQGDAPLEGEFADGKIAFAISLDSPEGAMSIGFAGAMKEDGTMAGTLTGPFGEAPWTATRVK
ncbi:MAG: hypothetical protein M3Q55_17485 [Acidobacteriota bacterium]|nr:hypothetical protein [Acidobacteriota bacterium]